jgi:cell division transport system permease protein
MVDAVRDRVAPLAERIADFMPRRGRGEPLDTSEAPQASAIVPEQTVAGQALIIVVGIMSFLACITVGAVVLVSDAARDWQADIARELTIQVRPIENVDVNTEAQKAATIASGAAGVRSARVLSEEEDAKLLEPWLGTGVDFGELPLPRLVVVEIGDPDAVDVNALSAQLKKDVRGASLDDHRAWTDRLNTMAGATVAIGLVVLGMVFLATALCVVFATRGAMAGNRDTVSVLHLVGAEDRFIVGEFQRHFLLLGLRGGLIGAGAAGILFLLMSLIGSQTFSAAEAEQVSMLFGNFAIGPTGYFGALGVAFLIAIMTAVTSRITVFRYLERVE